MFSARTNALRIGVIGVGDRGTQLAREAIACPGTELAAFADVYTRRLEDAAKLSPGAKTYTDYRQLLDDPSLDAVLIATPQHLHAECFIAAMDAGKHVYQEKAMAFTVEQAKAHARRVPEGREPASSRSAISPARSGHVADALNYLGSGIVGPGHGHPRHMYRNTPHGKPQWTRPVYPGHDARNHRLECVPRQRAARAISTPTATSTGVSSTTTPAATCTRTCPSSWRSGTR